MSDEVLLEMANNQLRLDLDLVIQAFDVVRMRLPSDEELRPEEVSAVRYVERVKKELRDE